MRTETTIPFAVSNFSQAMAEDGVQADVYLRHDKPVAIVLWRANEPQPYVAIEDQGDGRFHRFTLTANDDVPKHDRRESHLNVQIETFMQGDVIRGIALRKDAAADPFLTVVDSVTEIRTYPFNDRSNGIFANDFRDRNGLPVSDTFGATVRATLHGREARDWPVSRTASLIAEYSSGQMARIMDTVAVKSRDDAWREKYQNKGLAATEELATILSRRWPDTYRSPDDKAAPLPLVAVVVEPNTFSFFVTANADKKAVRVHQFTDFRGSILEDDFPFGSSNEWSASMPKTFTDLQAVDAVGRTLLKDWASLPKSFPAAEAPPYDPNDMDAAVAYSQRTKALFAKGDHDGAYALYMRDPNGGAQADFSQTTKEEFIVGMYSTRDVQGKPVYPQPDGYHHAGFTVGHEARLRDENSWGKIGHLFQFDGKPYVALEFDDSGNSNRLVATEQIDDTRPVADRPFRLTEIMPVIENTHDFLDDRLIGQHTDAERQKLIDTHRSLHLLRDLPSDQNHQPDVRRVLKEAHDLIQDRWGYCVPINQLRYAMTYMDHGLDAVGGKLPQRKAPQYELRRLDDDKLNAAFHTRAHAKSALDELDSSKPLTYYVVNTATDQRRVSFSGETALTKQGRTASEFFAARDNAAPELRDDQRAAVVAFRDAHGRDWKEKLGALWMNGNYSRRSIDTDQAALLQQVRNQFGPEWLVNVTRADLDAPKRVEHDDADLSI